jgi:hypothetical protein
MSFSTLLSAATINVLSIDPNTKIGFDWKKSMLPGLIVFALHAHLIAPIFLGLLLLGVLGAGVSSAPSEQLKDGLYTFFFLAACAWFVLVVGSAGLNAIAFRLEKEAWIGWLVSTIFCVLLLEIAPVAWFLIGVM